MNDYIYISIDDYKYLQAEYNLYQKQNGGGGGYYYEESSSSNGEMQYSTVYVKANTMNDVSAIQKEIENAITDYILENECEGKRLVVSIKNDKVEVSE